ncbi:MAG: hypothetical protein FJ299_07480 [Planctomycetes bacterium]|nr:hypothetical protein [Planctomycetota bacterium]
MLNTLLLFTVLSSPQDDTAPAASTCEWFWNGSARVELVLDPSRIALQFTQACPQDLARAVLGGLELLAPGEAERAPFLPGKTLRLATRAGTNAAQVEAAVEWLVQLPFVASASAQWLAGDEAYCATDELLVRFAPGIGAAERAALVAPYGLVERGALAYASNPGVVYGLAPALTPRVLEIARQLHDSGKVEFALPDFALVRVTTAATSDLLFANQWHLNSTGQAGALPDADVNAPEAWDITRGDPSLIAAVVDEGMDLTHPDLNLVSGTDVLDNDSNPAAQDGFFGLFPENHATAVAGVAAGRGDNNLGTSGAAQKCRVMPIRFLSSNFFNPPTVQDEADAFNFARANGAAIINNSWGPLASSAPLPASTKAAIDDCAAFGRGGLGTLIFFAAGNSGIDCSGIGYCSDPVTVAVSASNDQDLLSSYSNFGAPIDFCAPSNGGVTSGIWTTDRQGSKGYSSTDYASNFGGTSSASPLASGVALLVMSANPYLRWDEVVDVLHDTARKIDPAGGAYDVNGKSPKYGYGKVDAHAAVVEAQQRPPHGVVFYGAGLAGSGALVPKIGALQNPKSGNANFALTLSDAAALAPALLVVSPASANLPLFGGTLLVDVFGSTITLGALTSASGQASRVLSVPADPLLVGASVFAQWGVLDAGALQGVALSNAAQVTVLP